MDKKLHVVIVGAGLTGLAIAQGLKKNGISYVVVDRETGPRDRNWGVTVTWGHSSLAALLPENLFERLSECQPDPTLDAKEANCENVLLRDGKTGEPLLQPPFPGLRRLNLQKTKSMWAKGLNVKYGRRLSNVEVTPCGPIAHFEDGTSEAATIIVGADGASSRIRSWLFGDLAAPEALPYSLMNFSTKYTVPQALFLQSKMHPMVDVGIHPKSMYLGLFLLDKPDLDKPETWTYYILATWPKTTKEDKENTGDRLGRLRARMDGWAEPFKSAVEWVPDQTNIPRDELKVWAPPKLWDNHEGTVTLAGDAAHTMTFQRGQGANNALRDSERFVAAMVSVNLGEMSLREALDSYDEEIYERGKKEVEVSTMQTHATHDHGNYAKSSPVATHGVMPTIHLKS